MNEPAFNIRLGNVRRVWTMQFGSVAAKCMWFIVKPCATAVQKEYILAVHFRSLLENRYNENEKRKKKTKNTPTLERIKHCNGIYMHIAIEFHSFACASIFGCTILVMRMCNVHSTHNIDRKDDLCVNTPVINHIMQW